MEQKTLGKWQIVIGVIAIICWTINFIVTGIKMGCWRIGTDNVDLLLLGIFAIMTGEYNLKK
jgi:hypothetical protein